MKSLPFLRWNHFDDAGPHTIFVNPFYEFLEASELIHGLDRHQLKVPRANQVTWCLGD